MEYKFVSEESGPDLETEVNVLIADGWIPLGGVAVAVLPRFYPKWVYAQAMTRERAAEHAKFHCDDLATEMEEGGA